MAEPEKVVAQNRKARHDYHHRGHLRGGHRAPGHRGEVAARGAGLAGRRVRRDRRRRGLAARRAHPASTPRAPGPTTRRAASASCCCNRAEIDKIERRVNERGLTIVPLSLYFKDGRAKVEIALAKGKKTWDKRHALAERQATARPSRPSAAGSRACATEIGELRSDGDPRTSTCPNAYGAPITTVIDQRTHKVVRVLHTGRCRSTSRRRTTCAGCTSRRARPTSSSRSTRAPAASATRSASTGPTTSTSPRTAGTAIVMDEEHQRDRLRRPAHVPARSVGAATPAARARTTRTSPPTAGTSSSAASSAAPC